MSWQNLNELSGDFISWNNASIKVDNLIEENLDFQDIK